MLFSVQNFEIDKISKCWILMKLYDKKDICTRIVTITVHQFVSLQCQRLRNVIHVNYSELIDITTKHPKLIVSFAIPAAYSPFIRANYLECFPQRRSQATKTSKSVNIDLCSSYSNISQISRITIAFCVLWAEFKWQWEWNFSLLRCDVSIHSIYCNNSAHFKSVT